MLKPSMKDFDQPKFSEEHGLGPAFWTENSPGDPNDPEGEHGEFDAYGRPVKHYKGVSHQLGRKSAQGGRGKRRQIQQPDGDAEIGEFRARNARTT